MSKVKQYLGDGVYGDFDFDGEQIVLTTENGIRETNRIFLNQDVLHNLIAYVKDLADKVSRQGN
jgi:hypothetical protein